MRGAALLMLGAALLYGCNHSCQDTCGRIYSESECNVIVPGVTPERLRSDCEEQCENALTKAGSMGSYNPYNRAPPDREIVLENERQAAAWMECVWDVECAQLDPSSGICPPI
jgi:hypothetical protein